VSRSKGKLIEFAELLHKYRPGFRSFDQFNSGCFQFTVAEIRSFLSVPIKSAENGRQDRFQAIEKTLRGCGRLQAQLFYSRFLIFVSKFNSHST